MGGGLGAQSAAASAKRDPPGKQSEPESTKQNWEGGGAPCRCSGGGGRVPRADLLPGALWTRRGAVGREGGAFRDTCPGHCGSGRLGTRRYLSFASRGRSGSYSRPPSPSPSAPWRPPPGRVAGTHPGEVLLKGRAVHVEGTRLEPVAGRVDAGCALARHAPPAGVQALHRGGEGSARTGSIARALGVGSKRTRSLFGEGSGSENRTCGRIFRK